ncbi:hypothetical protein QOT17_017446 [Balamuthia mandrillaris]
MALRGGVTRLTKGSSGGLSFSLGSACGKRTLSSFASSSSHRLSRPAVCVAASSSLHSASAGSSSAPSFSFEFVSAPAASSSARRNVYTQAKVQHMKQNQVVSLVSSNDGLRSGCIASLDMDALLETCGEGEDDDDGM